MSDDTPDLNDPAPLRIQSWYVRERNALMLRGEFSELYTDFFLHSMEHQLNYKPEQADLLKDGLAVLGLHLAARPRNEAAAWTLSWQDPLQNIFITGSNRLGNLVCRTFTQDVRANDNNLLYAQATAPGQEPHQSIIEVNQLDWFRIGELYYQHSEQRPGRYFRHHDEDYVLITAQPDCDLDWFHNLDEASVRQIENDHTLTLLETRHYRFHCGCNLDRIFPIIAGMAPASVEEVFEASEVVTASCPRCGARYAVTREALEAYVAERQLDENR